MRYEIKFFFFFLNRVFGKNYQKMFLEKAECLAYTYKSDHLNYKLPKMTRYIQREFFVLITSLNASYGHNIFTKISQ